MALHSFNKTVTTAGAPERLLDSTVVPSVKCSWFAFQPLSTNTGNVYIGGLDSSGAADVTSTKGLRIEPGSGWVMWPLGNSNAIGLAQICIDSAVSGEGIQGVYFTT